MLLYSLVFVCVKKSPAGTCWLVVVYIGSEKNDLKKNYNYKESQKMLNISQTIILPKTVQFWYYLNESFSTSYLFPFLSK